MSGGIMYHDDSDAGFARRRVRNGWGYGSAAGNRITDREEVDRFDRAGLPPARRDTQFCPDAKGHIQAVGRDARGHDTPAIYRKPYVHPPMIEANKSGQVALRAMRLPCSAHRAPVGGWRARTGKAAERS